MVGTHTRNAHTVIVHVTIMHAHDGECDPEAHTVTTCTVIAYTSAIHKTKAYVRIVAQQQ